jgi:alanine racemase
MAREGCPPSLWPHLVELAAAAERRHEVEVVGIMGHLSSADLPADPANVRERLAFARGLQLAHGAGLRPPLHHLAATAATLTQPGARQTLCRVGAGLVGIDPSGRHALHQVFTLEAPIVDVREVAAGTAVGNGHSWRAPTATRLALVAVGYADGVSRAAVPGAEVLVRGRRRPVVGLVSMDQLVVDLGDGDAASGEHATIFGPGEAGEPTIADWARWGGTIPHEVVTGIGARVARHVLQPAGVAR